jgi:hypothetical protein
MLKNLLLITLLSIVFSFNIQNSLSTVVNDEILQLKAVNWPFTICGSEDKWTAKKVTLNKAPAKGAQLEV